MRQSGILAALLFVLLPSVHAQQPTAGRTQPPATGRPAQRHRLWRAPRRLRPAAPAAWRRSTRRSATASGSCRSPTATRDIRRKAAARWRRGGAPRPMEAGTPDRHRLRRAGQPRRRARADAQAARATSFARSASGMPTWCWRRDRTTIIPTTATPASCAGRGLHGRRAQHHAGHAGAPEESRSSCTSRTASSGRSRSGRTWRSSIDDVFDKKIDMLDAHVSQFYEWLPWVGGNLDAVPKDPAARKAWLRRRATPAVRRRARRRCEVVRRRPGEDDPLRRGVRDLRVRHAPGRCDASQAVSVLPVTPHLRNRLVAAAGHAPAPSGRGTRAVWGSTPRGRTARTSELPTTSRFWYSIRPSR